VGCTQSPEVSLSPEMSPAPSCWQGPLHMAAFPVHSPNTETQVTLSHCLCPQWAATAWGKMPRVTAAGCSSVPSTGSLSSSRECLMAFEGQWLGMCFSEKKWARLHFPLLPAPGTGRPQRQGEAECIEGPGIWLSPPSRSQTAFWCIKQ
jgi:hypothetical protein